MGELQVIYLPLSALTPDEKNAKQHPADQVEQIKESIKTFKMCDPIGIAGDENLIIEGHGRYMALQELGVKEAPCIRLDHLDTDEKRKAYALIHNKTTMNSGFDIELLDMNLAEIETIDMSLYGFEQIEEETDEKPPKDDSIAYFTADEIKQDIIDAWNPKPTVEEFIADIIDIPTAKYQFNRLCQGYDTGSYISLLFNPHRLETPTKNKNSLYWGILHDEKYKKGFARLLVDLYEVVPPCRYHLHIGFGTQGYQRVHEFQPYLAQRIYKKYCTNGSKILNPCAGWGGRLLGIASCLFKDIEYVETDPSTKTYNGLVKLKQFLRLGDNYKQYNLPFEDLEVKKNYFDFVFTSPPYFDTEQYADEETQSYKRNETYDAWKENFLFVMIDKIIYCMKTDAVCMLNVGNKRYHIAEDIIDYLRDKYGINAKYDTDFKLDSESEAKKEKARNSEEVFIVFKK